MKQLELRLPYEQSISDVKLRAKDGISMNLDANDKVNSTIARECTAPRRTSGNDTSATSNPPGDSACQVDILLEVRAWRNNSLWRGRRQRWRLRRQPRPSARDV